MLTSPLVSVIMPAHNAQEHILESINSVISQTYQNWELIIVNDGSTDDTAAIIAEYQQKHPKIKSLSQQRGRQGKARNAGIKASLGSYIAFLDADDTWMNEKLELQMNILQQRPDVDLIFSAGYSLRENGQTDHFYVSEQEWNYENDFEKLVDVNQIPILSVIVKKKALTAVGLFCEDASIQNTEDFHLWVKLLQHRCRFLSVNTPLFYYRVHDKQSTHKSLGVPDITIDCYIDLVKNNFIPIKSPALRNRLRWMIFQPLNHQQLFEKMKYVFPEKERLLTIFSYLSKNFSLNRTMKKLAFQLLK